MRTNNLFCILISVCFPTLAGSFTDISLTRSPDTEVRLCSDKLVYVEALKDGRWVGKYWSPDARLGLPYDSWAEDAFQIEIDKQPITNGWVVALADELPKNERGARHFVVTLTNSTHAISVQVHSLLDGTPVLVRWLEVSNQSDKAIPLTALYPWAGKFWPVPPPIGPEGKGQPGSKGFTLGSFTKDVWAFEGWLEWKQLPDGVTSVKCDKGVGHDDPFFVLRNDSNGEYFIGHLAWTANYNLEFKKDQSGLTARLGPAAVAPIRVLAPGERMKSPALHLCHTSGSLDLAVQSLHDHLRRSVLPTRPLDRSYRIQYLVPADQGYYTPFDEASAMKCAEVAADIGAELFILDAYWWDITCDWVPSAKRFPNGLKPLIDYVHKRGMLFGLYVETEGGRGPIQQSKMYKEHPEWFMPKNIVNLSIPEAAAWVEAENCRMVEEFGLDLFRLDYNPYHTGEGITMKRSGIEENNYSRYYDVFYDMYERMAKKYPKLILQQCAAGGARNDLGVSSRFHEIYLTDGLSIPRELQVYSGQSLALPPENFVILHGADGGQSVGKPQNLDTVLRLSYTLSTPQVFVGTVSPSVQTLSPWRKERFLHYGKLYREFIRPLWPTCKLYHHEPVNAKGGVESSGFFAMEFGTPDKSKGWATLVRLGPAPSDEYLLKPRGLDRAKTYEVTFDSSGEKVRIDGFRLMNEGLSIRLESVGTSELLLFNAAR